ncbi:MAG: hypothetical protein N2688_07175 [Burkholderiaceae bacterium]|nr:hypothetical protein [Burkholderiaceae bacterium]
MEGLATVFLIIALFLMTRRGFWVLVFFFGALASPFAMLASRIHFPILGPLRCFVLMALCFGLLSRSLIRNRDTGIA